MSDSLSQVVETYKALINDKYVIKEAKTPFIDESLLPDSQLQTEATPGENAEEDNKANEASKEKSQKKPKSKNKGDDDKDKAKVAKEKNDSFVRGELSEKASSILMSILYTARLARFDLLRPVCALASCITRWTPQCDRMLYKLICYINSTKYTVFMTGFVGDELKHCELRLYTDADLAGSNSPRNPPLECVSRW